MTRNLANKLKKMLIKICLPVCTFLVVNPGHAAEVIFEDVSFISGVNGVGGTNTSFAISQRGIYEAELVDFVFPSSFDSLGLSITEGATTELNRQISTSGGFSFTFEANPGLHFANVFGDAGGAMNIGMYGLKISQLSAVPLPTAMGLFISAMFILLRFTDKGKAWKNKVLNIFTIPQTWRPA